MEKILETVIFHKETYTPAKALPRFLCTYYLFAVMFSFEVFQGS